MIGEFVKFIETLKVEEILVVFALYVVFLWLLVPIWVFLDSKKKFDNIYLSILLFILVLPLNIPGLLFYIIIRPNEFEAMDDLAYGYNNFNVPIVNFVNNKNDLVMGIELKINGNILKPEIARDLNLTVNMDHSEEIEIKKVNMAPVRTESKFLTGLSSKLSSAKNKIKEKANKLKSMRTQKEDEDSVAVVTETKVEESTQVQASNNQQNNNQNNNYKNKHNHNHNKHK